MAPDLLLHPVFDEAEALAGMPHREVIHPPPEHRIDQVYHPFNRLRPVSAEHLFERPQQGRDAATTEHLRQTITETQNLLKQQVAAIQAAFDKAVDSYSEIDRLFPEKKIG